MPAEAQFPIVDVSQWEIVRSEPMGGKTKDWRSEPVTTHHWLYKEVGRKSGGTTGDSEEYVGEDWAEKVVAELATLAGIPAAAVELATKESSRGCISLSIVDSDEELVHGNELLWGTDRTYPRMKNFGAWYTVDASIATIRRRSATMPDGFGDAAVSFASYLVLDAWVSNTDRHHENWGVLVRPDGRVRMAPGFDQGSSLGFNLTDDERLRRLTTKDRGMAIETWARRGKSPFYAGSRLSLVDAAKRAVQTADVSLDLWAAGLAKANAAVPDILERVPSTVMSNASKEFVARLLDINLNRLMG